MLDLTKPVQVNNTPITLLSCNLPGIYPICGYWVDCDDHVNIGMWNALGQNRWQGSAPLVNVPEINECYYNYYTCGTENESKSFEGRHTSLSNAQLAARRGPFTTIKITEVDGKVTKVELV